MHLVGECASALPEQTFDVLFEPNKASEGGGMRYHEDI